MDYIYSDEAKALRTAVEDKREALEVARKKLNRVTKPESVSLARTVYASAALDLEEAMAAVRLGRRAALSMLDDEALLKRHAAAANYSYEANMSDYSMGSINRAAEDLADVKAVLESRGFDTLRTIISAGARGWIPVHPATARHDLASKAATVVGEHLTVARGNGEGNRIINVTHEAVTMHPEAFAVLIEELATLRAAVKA